jgi:hypothetical protein
MLYPNAINANAQSVTATTATTENSNQQPQRTKCANFGNYSLYAVPIPAGLGFLSHIVSTKCGISAFSSLMCSTGVASCSFVTCSIMYCAHTLSDKKTRVENKAKIGKDTEGYVELLRLTDPVTKQPRRRSSEDSISLDSSLNSSTDLDYTATAGIINRETAV